MPRLSATHRETECRKLDLALPSASVSSAPRLFGCSVHCRVVPYQIKGYGASRRRARSLSERACGPEGPTRPEAPDRRCASALATYVSRQSWTLVSRGGHRCGWQPGRRRGLRFPANWMCMVSTRRGMGYTVPMADSRHVDHAIAELRGIGDPYRRLRQADELDAALAAARTVVAQIRQDTIRSLRGPVTGYGTIAQRLGLTKSRVQQIANAPARQIVAAYAFRDQRGQWHGQPRMLQEGSYREAPTFIPFDPPADKYNPLGGQILAVRYGPVTHDEQVSVYTLQIRQDDGSPLNLRMTNRVQDALFGPPILPTPERARWDQAREQRRREVDGS